MQGHAATEEQSLALTLGSHPTAGTVAQVTQTSTEKEENYSVIQGTRDRQQEGSRQAPQERGGAGG